MGVKKKVSKQQFDYTNVTDFTSYKKKDDVVIIPRNKHQENYLLKLLDLKKDIVFGVGPAGTGKTMLGVLAAIKMFKEKSIDRIIITRPAVSVDEDLGFLPGTLEQKMAPWVLPIFDILRDYFNPKQIEGMMSDGVIEIAPLSYMRGRTFHNSFIIFDEAQLSTPSQMKMILTRLGSGSKMVVTGDLAQSDRLSDNGLKEFIELMRNNHTDHLDIVYFSHEDIERHDAVKEVLKIYKEN